jgi:4-hydroxy-tetrahydrodipicolinate synthase
MNIQASLAALVSMLHNLDAFISVEKTLLVEQGVFENALVRGPVGFRLDEETKEQVLHLFRHLKTVCAPKD